MAEAVGKTTEYSRVAIAAVKVAGVASQQLIENGKITSWSSLACAAMAPTKLAGGTSYEGLVSGKTFDYVSPWLGVAEKAVKGDKITAGDWEQQ